MPKPTVLALFPPNHYALRYLNPLRDKVNLLISGDKTQLEEYAKQAEIVLSSNLPGTPVPLRDIWLHSKDLRWVHSLSAGLDNLLFPELVHSTVPVTNARGVFKRPLAEFAVLGMLFFYKHVRQLLANQQAHRWEDVYVDSLPGQVMGVVGYGEIGRECAILAKALGLKIYATRRNMEKSADDPILERAYRPDQLSEMLQELDFLVVAAPLTPETRHMIGAPQFEAMKPSAIVINVGRGPVIDQTALIAALQNKQIAAAALDVFEQEPLPADNPLWNMDNVLISPHSADRTRNPDWLELAMQMFAENLERYTSGRELLNVVDKRAGY